LRHDHHVKITIAAASGVFAALAGALVLAGLPRASGAPTTTLTGTLPAAFARLQCRHCEDETERVELHPDGVFAHRLRLEGSTEPSDDIGRWELSPDGTQLTLRGGREAPVRFNVERLDRLQRLTPTGKPEPSRLALRRIEPFVPMEPELFVAGLYSSHSGIARFVECVTGLDLPVAREGVHGELAQAYLASRSRAGDDMLMSLDARIAASDDAENQTARLLVPLRLVGSWPGRGCPGASGPDF
jgi:copper homeostasis protein (lipoprotein)